MAEFSISNYYRAIQGRIIQDIEVLEASDLDGTDTEHWVTYYIGFLGVKKPGFRSKPAGLSE
ncbi:MAG: hypothetical protein V1932_04955 [Chloroflexota bacterium]